jgi:S-(hydroxymethyl)glutathione dehydrogenase/class III alcohol dehydrogenase/S-formylglutathione hydrolase
MEHYTENNVGKIITCKAAVAWEAKKPLDITEIQVEPPRKGEVRIKVLANALCHTDIYTLDGHDPEGIFPCILGHEATGIVESVGERVTSVQVGDIVIPCYTPECREYNCLFCQNENTNLCPKIRATQGKGLMPDGTSRYSKDGKVIYHFMGCSTFSEYAVISEISCAKINPNADVNKVCLLGCGISTGWGAAVNTCKVFPGSSCVVFGLGAVGLAVIQSCKERGATKIIGVDINSKKFKLAEQLGATECLNSAELQGQTIKDFLLSKEKWGYNFTFDCTGNVQVMRDALELSHRGFGESCVIGVAKSGHEIATRPFQLVTGRQWKGTAFGGWKSRTEVPKLVNKVARGEVSLDPFVSHEFKGLENVNKSIDILHSGDCIRAVIQINERSIINSKFMVKVRENIRHNNGWVKRVTHWSNANNCYMNFSIYLPDQKNRNDPPLPVLFFLAGLGSTDENALVKSSYGSLASKIGLALVFPDTSARGVNIEGQDDNWDFGTSAGFYVDATTEKWKQNYNNYTYITKELPELISSVFPVDISRQSITGFSMGGHGALTIFLKNPGLFKSVSAFAPICHPTTVSWGKKAFEGYLGSVEAGIEYDATELIKKYNGPKSEILIDQGTNDKFLNTQLKPEDFANACFDNNYPLKLRYQPYYDHSFYFISSFIEDHIKHHAKALGL